MNHPAVAVTSAVLVWAAVLTLLTRRTPAGSRRRPLLFVLGWLGLAVPMAAVKTNGDIAAMGWTAAAGAVLTLVLAQGGGLHAIMAQEDADDVEPASPWAFAVVIGVIVMLGIVIFWPS